MDEVKAWTEAHADNSDWRMQVRTLHQFSDRWRNAGHLNEKPLPRCRPNGRP